MANLHYIINGGAEGDRTPDLMTASHALSQLSYSPVYGEKFLTNATECVNLYFTRHQPDKAIVYYQMGSSFSTGGKRLTNAWLENIINCLKMGG